MYLISKLRSGFTNTLLVSYTIQDFIFRRKLWKTNTIKKAILIFDMLMQLTLTKVFQNHVSPLLYHEEMNRKWHRQHNEHKIWRSTYNLFQVRKSPLSENQNKNMVNTYNAYLQLKIHIDWLVSFCRELTLNKNIRTQRFSSEASCKLSQMH